MIIRAGRWLESVGMVLNLELEREDDGRWIGAVPALPGALAYGATQDEAARKVAALALRVLADQLEHAETQLDGLSISFGTPAIN